MRELAGSVGCHGSSRLIHRKVPFPTLLLALVLALLLTGCWDYTELNSLDIVVGLALDVGEQKSHLLSVELVAFEDGHQTGRILTAEGDDYDECVHSIVRQLGRRPNLSHAKMLLFSEEFARRNMTDFLNWATQDHNIPFGILMAMVQDDYALQLLRAGNEPLPHSLSLASMLHNDQANGKIHANPLYEFYNATMTVGAIVSVPVLRLREEPDYGGAAEGPGSAGGDIAPAPESAQSELGRGRQHAYFVGVQLFAGGVPITDDYFRVVE